MTAETYREPPICDECGCFLSRHDDLCSQWTEPDEPGDINPPIPYVLTGRGRAIERVPSSRRTDP